MAKIGIDGDLLNPSQNDFADCKAREVLFSGGYGAGKTLALAVKMQMLLLANPGTPGLLVAPNWRTMWGVTHRCIVSLLSAFCELKTRLSSLRR